MSDLRKNTAWSRTGKCHYTKYVEGTRVVVRKVDPYCYGGEAEVGGDRVTVIEATSDAAKKAIVPKVKSAIAQMEALLGHTPQTDLLAQRIVEARVRARANGERMSGPAMQRHDGMCTAWEIVTGAMASEEGLAKAAERHLARS